MLLTYSETLSWLGRVPSKIGYTVGGSLTVDGYKVLALAYLPISLSASFFFTRDRLVQIDNIQDTTRMGRVAARCPDVIRGQTEKNGGNKKTRASSA